VLIMFLKVVANTSLHLVSIPAVNAQIALIGSFC